MNLARKRVMMMRAFVSRGGIAQERVTRGAPENVLDLRAQGTFGWRTGRGGGGVLPAFPRGRRTLLGAAECPYRPVATGRLVVGARTSPPNTRITRGSITIDDCIWSLQGVRQTPDKSS